MTTYTSEFIEILLTASHDAIAILDGDYNIHKANALFYKLFHLEASQTKSKPFFEIRNKSWDIPEIRDLLSRTLSEKTLVEKVSVEMETTTDITHNLCFSARKTENPTYIFLTVEVLEEGKQSHDFLYAVLNSAYYGIASYEPIRNDSGKITDFRIAYSNREVPANFGLTVTDVVGKTCREVYPGIFGNGIFDRMVTCMQSGEPDTYEVDVQQNDKTIWFTAAIEKVCDSVTVSSKNVTKEKETALHLEHMNELLNNKNKELASFTYIASHDLQEPLRKIQMFASRILENDKANFSETALHYFNSMTATANRMQHLIDAVLSYSSMDSEKVKAEKTDLNKLLKEVLLLMDNALEEKQAVIEKDELPTLKIIPIQFQQLLLNILNNALKYSKPDEKPVINIKTALDVSQKQHYWKISISDNGIGFDPQYKDKIFEVFQRLHGKKEYVGTGVGLAICQKIAKNHNGYITADGEPGIGATFHIFMPTKD